MAAYDSQGICLDIDASDFAFRAGKIVEQMLVSRGIELARAAGTVIVTRELVEPCLDESFVSELKKRLGELIEADCSKVA